MFHDENRKDYDYYKVKHKDTLQWTMIQDDKKCVNSGKTTISSRESMIFRPNFPIGISIRYYRLNPKSLW